MKKAVIQLGYTHYVLDTQKALTLLALLEEAEIYETNWRATEEGGATQHIYEQPASTMTSVQLMPDNLYRMAKLAGKPE
jgi:hypothetical protein